MTDADQPEERETHLSRILTNREVLDNPSSFFQVYQLPIRRFFLCLTREQNTADDLFQDFAVKFLRGDLETYTPEKGRFRDFLKVTLRNQVRKNWRSQNKLKKTFGAELTDDAAGQEDKGIEAALREFDISEGAEIRKLISLELKSEEEAGKHSFYSLLGFLFSFQEEQTSARIPVKQVAEFLSELKDTRISEDNAKKQKSRAASSYAGKMITEIGNRIGTSDLLSIKEAAADLGLLMYCGKEIKKRMDK